MSHSLLSIATSSHQCPPHFNLALICPRRRASSRHMMSIASGQLHGSPRPLLSATQTAQHRPTQTAQPRRKRLFLLLLLQLPPSNPCSADHRPGTVLPCALPRRPLIPPHRATTHHQCLMIHHRGILKWCQLCVHVSPQLQRMFRCAPLP